MNYLFPLKLHLQILQLEEYKLNRYLRWIATHYTKRSLPNKKTLVITQKVKLIIFLSAVWLFVFFTLMFTLTLNALTALIGAIILLTQPFILFSLAVITLKPYEYFNKQRIMQKTQAKIATLPKLKVIAISGSFGKTSTKELLFQILSRRFKVIKTPESFNTVFGIAKVVDYEVDHHYDIFICEMAAYKIGEIKQLASMIPPEYGILTGITSQHLERFGSLENTISAKFELVDAIKDPRKLVFNIDNEYIVKELQRRHIKPVYSYSLHDHQASVYAKDIDFSKSGSSFKLIIGKSIHKINTSLFGFAAIQNLLAAISMAMLCGMETKDLVKIIPEVTPPTSRFVRKIDGKSTIIDNTYSSNFQSFIEMLETAKKVTGSKVLVTPGLVELGKTTAEVHQKLGVLSRNVFDHIILVGKNDRTIAFASGLGETKDLTFIKDTRKTYFTTLESLKNKYEWIFLENDITQNY